jgi:serine palmitoyltransferase
MTSNPSFELFKRILATWSAWSPERVWDVIMHAPQYYETWWTTLLNESPQHVLIETSLIIFIIWLLFIRRTVDPKKTTEPAKLNAQEIEWLLDSWQPEPLVPPLSAADQALVENMHIIENYDGDYLQLRGMDSKVLNTASFDFLGLSQDESIKQAAREALDKYGCGSSGPRGFYGTFDQHLILEEALAEFMGSQEAICYSDGASATSSAIPAFAKKGDLLIVDEACNEPVMMGVNLSRSTVKYFKHNDMADLRRLLLAIKEDDKRLRRDTLQQRRFIVVEGVYRATGDLCPLPELVKLKEEFCYRLLLDESLSFGILGSTGRGVTEHYGIARSHVEVITFTLDTVLASVGGVCVGTREIVDHQRLSGAGYCYSASSAPFLCAAATAALKQLDTNSAVLLDKLRKIAEQLHRALDELPHLALVGKNASVPVLHLVLSQPLGSREEEIRVLGLMATGCVQAGVGLVLSKHSVKFAQVRPSLMLTVHATFSAEAVLRVAHVIATVSRAILLGGQ